MKNNFILLPFAFLLLVGCSYRQNFYHGYVYYNQQPLKDVVVKKRGSNPSEIAKTDSTGFFVLPKNPEILDDLIFIRKGFQVDTIRTVWTQYGERVEYTFLNREFDTIRLRSLVD